MTKNIFGILLIAVFALCNTPVKVLHHLFANHTDYVNTHLSNSSSPQLCTTGIDCHCQSNVVVSPYTFGGYIPITKKVISFTNFDPRTVSGIPFTRNITFGLRGPPQLIV